MSAVSELHAAREARTTARDTARDTRETKARLRGKDADHQRAYEAGRAGEDFPFEGENDELYDSYTAGADEAEADREAAGSSPSSPRRASSGRRPAVKAASALRRVTSGSVGAVAGGDPSPLELLGFAILLAGLYLVLSNAGAVANVVNGARSALVWLIDPHATIGGKS